MNVAIFISVFYLLTTLTKTSNQITDEEFRTIRQAIIADCLKKDNAQDAFKKAWKDFAVPNEPGIKKAWTCIMLTTYQIDEQGNVNATVFHEIFRAYYGKAPADEIAAKCMQIKDNDIHELVFKLQNCVLSVMKTHRT